MNNINRHYAARVYDVLIVLGEAHNDMNAKWRFIEYVVNYDHSHVEWVWYGENGGENPLGRGGKFRINPIAGWVVSCYTEDWNMYRQMVIDSINAELALLRAEFLIDKHMNGME